jgi:hypothetical protein
MIFPTCRSSRRGLIVVALGITTSMTGCYWGSVRQAQLSRAEDAPPRVRVRVQDAAMMFAVRRPEGEGDDAVFWIRPTLHGALQVPRVEVLEPVIRGDTLFGGVPGGTVRIPVSAIASIEVRKVSPLAWLGVAALGVGMVVCMTDDQGYGC